MMQEIEPISRIREQDRVRRGGNTSQKLGEHSRWFGSQNTGYINQIVGCAGGANRNRTDDLLNAIQALSQLSYGPINDP
jgi:hypothetical protein